MFAVSAGLFSHTDRWFFDTGESACCAHVYIISMPYREKQVIVPLVNVQYNVFKNLSSIAFVNDGTTIVWGCVILQNTDNNNNNNNNHQQNV